jgi:hypothetical protein
MKEDMDLLMKNELLPMGRDGVLAGGRQFLWEEGIQDRKSSILKILITRSDLITEDILGIKYIYKIKHSYREHLYYRNCGLV